MRKIIVTRHPATAEFIARELGGLPGENHVRVPNGTHGCAQCGTADHPDCYDSNEETIPVLASATSEDVRGAVVYGNLPLHLAALAAEVWAVEFAGAPPRGVEYGIEEMRAAGARLVPYRVLNAAGIEAVRAAAHADGYGPHPYCLLPLPGEKNPYQG